MLIYKHKYGCSMNYKFLALIAIAATGLLGVSQMGLSQHASAVSDNANPVAQTVSRDGTSPNQAYMQSCKQYQSASDCATDPYVGNGPFTSDLAKAYNGPN